MRAIVRVWDSKSTASDASTPKQQAMKSAGKYFDRDIFNE